MKRETCNKLLFIGCLLALFVMLGCTISTMRVEAKTKIEKATETDIKRYAKKTYNLKGFKIYSEGKVGKKALKTCKSCKKLPVEKITLTIKDQYGQAKTEKGKPWYIDGLYDDFIKGKKCWVYLAHNPKTGEVDQMFYAIPSGCRKR